MSLIVEKLGLRSGIAFDRSVHGRDASTGRGHPADAAAPGQLPPKAATAASILGSGRSLVMTTWTVSGSAPSQATTVCSRLPVELSRRRVGLAGEGRGRFAGHLGAVGRPRARDVEVGDAVPRQAGRLEGHQRGRAIAAEIPGAAGEADLGRCRRRPGSRGSRPCSCGPSRGCRAPALVRRRDARLEVRIGTRRGPVRGARAGRIERRRGAGAGGHEQRQDRDQEDDAQGSGGACGRRVRGGPRSVRRRAGGASWHLVPRPGVVRACARPIDPGQVGTEGPLPLRGRGAYCAAYADPRSNRGNTWGVGHGSGAGHFLEEVRVRDPGSRSRAE